MSRQVEGKTKVWLNPLLQQWSAHSRHYQSLATRLLRLEGDSSSLVERVGVTSCSPRAGTTTVAMQLAAAMSRVTGDETILVDANHDNPMSVLGDESPGLLSFLSGDAETCDCVYQTDVSNLSIVPHGLPSWGKPEYDRANIEEFFSALTDKASQIVVDLPAVTSASHWHDLAQSLDGVVLVVAARETRAPAAQAAERLLKQSDVNLFGVVLNKCPEK